MPKPAKKVAVNQASVGMSDVDSRPESDAGQREAKQRAGSWRCAWQERCEGYQEGICGSSQIEDVKNPGVEERAARDRLQEAERTNMEEKAAVILQKKANLYDKLSMT